MNNESVKEKLKDILQRPIEANNMIGVMSTCSLDDFDDYQEGFRFNPVSNEPIKDWIGDNYYVIGIDSTMGDPFIIDVEKEGYPVYAMYHDDWSSLRQISKDYDTFYKILSLLKEIHLNMRSTKEDAIKAVEQIKEIEDNYIDYWETLLVFED